MAQTSSVKIPLPDGQTMRGFLALPDGSPPPGGWPAMLAIHDIAGFRDDIRRIARRFADAGIAALAPALFDASGPPGICVFRTLRDCQKGEGPAFERVDSAHGLLADRAEIDEDRIGITGFCLGGGFAIFYAARGGVRVCAPYYGDTPAHAEQLQGVCPVVAGFGELDRPFAEKGRRLERHLTELGIPHDVKIYPKVGHSYMNDHGTGPVLSAFMRATPLHAAYDEEAAEDSWKRMFEFFERHL